MSRISYALLVLGLLVPSQVSAQTISTDRPDATESTFVVGPNRYQLETGASRAKTGDVSVDQFLGSVLRVGLSDRFEFRLGWDGFLSAGTDGSSSADIDGAGDLNVGFKTVLLDAPSDRTRLAVEGTVFIPSGAESVRRHDLTTVLLLAASRPLAAGFSVGANVGFSAEPGNDDRPVIALYSVSFARGVGDSAGFFVELFGSTGDEVTALSADTGLTIVVRENVQLDIFFGVGLNEYASDWFGGLGASFRLPN